jgi:hypothetical protein
MRNAELRSDRLRPLGAPRRIEVERDAAGSPTAVRLSDRPTDRRSVLALGDSWRLDDEWWRVPIARRYLELHLEGGGRMVVFEDLLTGEWFVQA